MCCDCEGIVIVGRPQRALADWGVSLFHEKSPWQRPAAWEE